MLTKKLWYIFEKNSLTDIDAQAFEYDLDGVRSAKRIEAVFKPGTYLGGIHWIDRRGLKGFGIQQLR